jgi:uncharacterized protein (TIGR03435 family)
MNHRVAILIAIPLLNASASHAQSPKFDAAAIRLCTSSTGRGGDTKQGPGGGGNPFGTFSVSPGRLNTGCRPLATSDATAALIQRVYGRLGLGHTIPPGTALPISGGPAWAYSDAYDINAIAANNANETVMEGPMLQALLEDRFKLRLHRESKDVPVYALTVAKGGPKLKPSKAGTCVAFDFTKGPQPLPPGQQYCDSRIGRRGPDTTIDAEGSTLGEFSRLLTLILDRPIVDKTGISGKFDIQLEFAIDETTPGAPPLPPGPNGPSPGAPPSDAAPAPSVFTVVQQSGLKLDPTKGPREFLVIDSIQRPSEN